MAVNTDKFITRLTRTRMFYTWLIRRHFKNIEVHNGGHLELSKTCRITGNSKLKFNVSHYENGYHREGNLNLRDNAELHLFNDDKVVIYSGCKIDVHENACLGDDLSRTE